MSSYQSNVFINCPFDDEYKKKFLYPLIFTIIHSGFNPKISFEESNASNTRMDKIIELIRDSKFGIHDISRYKSSTIGEYYRMNMPLELGIDIGLSKSKSEQFNSKQILILCETKYEWSAALSDLSNCDPETYNQKVRNLIEKTRNWLNRFKNNKLKAASAIWKDYNIFQAYLLEKLLEKGYTVRETKRAPSNEIINHMQSWVSENSIK